MFEVEVADDGGLSAIEDLEEEELVLGVLSDVAEPDGGYLARVGMLGFGVPVFGDEGVPDDVLSMEEVWIREDGDDVCDFIRLIEVTNVGDERSEDRAGHGSGLRRGM